MNDFKALLTEFPPKNDEKYTNPACLDTQERREGEKYRISVHVGGALLEPNTMTYTLTFPTFW